MPNRDKEACAKTKFLLICTGNKDRSLRAAALYRQYMHLEVGSAGTSKCVKTPLREEMVRATDVLVMMERGHVEHLQEHHPEASESKPLYCLDIPDEFQSMHPTLVRMLQERLQPIVNIYIRGE